MIENNTGESCGALPKAPSGASLEAVELAKQWPMKRVSVSFALKAGESIALLGPSGCGKSSVLRMIAGFLSPDSGTLLMDGRDIAAVPPGKRSVGMVFQEHTLFSHLRVDDNIGYGLISGGMSRRESREAAAQWLERFGLQGFGRRRIESLSGGEKQRIALARTLAPGPRVVLFDEPLSALDANLRGRLRSELRERQLELGYTAIYVTHDEEEALVLADRVVRMD